MDGRPAWTAAACSTPLSRRARGRASRQEVRAGSGHGTDGPSCDPNVFPPPTALKLRRRANMGHGGIKLRSIISGGESHGAELLDWVRAAFGVEAHEICGQSECNLVVDNNAKLFPVRPGSMGKATTSFIHSCTSTGTSSSYV